MMRNEIYLASTSPRRCQLLDQLGIPHDTLAPDIDETPWPGEEPTAYVLRLARDKAAAGLRLAGRRGLLLRPVLAADTTVVIDGELLGKPADLEAAREMLLRLSGRTHQVLTGVALAWSDRVQTALSDSSVQFAPLPDDWLNDYLASGEPLGKAGAYGVQGRAAAMIRTIEGSYSGIMGLPLFETAALLRQAALERA